MKKYFCPKCEIEKGPNDVTLTGESEIKTIDAQGKVGAGGIYKCKKCGSIIAGMEEIK